jgi:hypothetical protein
MVAQRRKYSHFLRDKQCRTALFIYAMMNLRGARNAVVLAALLAVSSPHAATATSATPDDSCQTFNYSFGKCVYCTDGCAKSGSCCAYDGSGNITYCAWAYAPCVV